jgi:phosphate acetyltransferase
MHHKSIYIASAEPQAGSLIISIGFMEMLKGRYERVAFFRPVIAEQEREDEDIRFMLEHFGLDMTYDECCGFTVSEYIDAYGEDKEEKLYEALIRRVKKLHKNYDFVLIEGASREIFGGLFDFDINLEIAKNLDTVFISILNAQGKSSNKIVNEIQITS